jgi:hypothetical protein
MRMKPERDRQEMIRNSTRDRGGDFFSHIRPRYVKNVNDGDDDDLYSDDDD